MLASTRWASAGSIRSSVTVSRFGDEPLTKTWASAPVRANSALSAAAVPVKVRWPPSIPETTTPAGSPPTVTGSVPLAVFAQSATASAPSSRLSVARRVSAASAPKACPPRTSGVSTSDSTASRPGRSSVGLRTRPVTGCSATVRLPVARSAPSSSVRACPSGAARRNSTVSTWDTLVRSVSLPALNQRPRSPTVPVSVMALPPEADAETPLPVRSSAPNTPDGVLSVACTRAPSISAAAADTPSADSRRSGESAPATKVTPAGSARRGTMRCAGCTRSTRAAETALMPARPLSLAARSSSVAPALPA